MNQSTKTCYLNAVYENTVDVGSVEKTEKLTNLSVERAKKRKVLDRRMVSTLLTLMVALLVLMRAAMAENLRNLAIGFDITDSTECLSQCLGENQVFCEEYSWATPGVRGTCCDLIDDAC